MKFSLPDTTKAKLVSVNFRSQLHGDEHVPAEGSPEAAFLDTVRERAASGAQSSESSVVSITRKGRRGAAVE